MDRGLTAMTKGPLVAALLCLAVNACALRGGERALVAGAVVVDGTNAIWRYDTDVGGYHDRWQSKDKIVHAAFGYVATDGCGVFGGRRFVCAGLVGFGGLGWEYSQGVRSNKDAYATLGGALTNAVLHWAQERVMKGTTPTGTPSRSLPNRPLTPSPSPTPVPMKDLPVKRVPKSK
jgi:hypothetical protein